MRRRNSKRVPKRNNRERKQTATGCSEDKLKAFERLFEGMTAEEVVAELNHTWIDARYRVVIIDGHKLIEEDKLQGCFEGWEVYHV